MKRFVLVVVLTLAVIALGGYAAYRFLAFEQATLAVEDSYGAYPTLPAPNKTLIPTVNIAPTAEWGEDAAPVPPAGFKVTRFSQGLDHPRWMHVLPNGDVLVAETNRPERPADTGFSFRAWAADKVMAWAGASSPSANRISLLRDSDGDGIAELKTPYLEGLNSPFGMALIGNTLFIANADSIVSVPFTEGETQNNAKPEHVIDLPAGINHHWTKDLIASPDGTKLYATVGSNSNVGENGMDIEQNRAAVLEFDIATRTIRPFATGLRNPNGLSWNEQSGALWVAVNERDEIGSDLVPDYMTSVKEGAFYGWPYSYWGQTVDKRVQPQKPELVAKAIKPDYALGPHTASLGMAFYGADLFSQQYRNGAFIGQHGSWNRRPRSGYKVIFVPFENGVPAGVPQDFLTGFLDADGNARGRPVGVTVDGRGGLLVADDVGDIIWRVVPDR